MKRESRTNARPARLSNWIKGLRNGTHARYMTAMHLLGLGIVSIVATVVAILAANSGTVTVTPTGAPESVTIPQQMLEDHDCWSGPAPADMVGKLPSHAVVELDARRGPQYVNSSIGFDIWQHGRAGTLYGFCR